MVKKILFFGLSIIIGLMLMMTSYSSFYIGHIQDTVNSDIENDNYDGLAKMFINYFNEEEHNIAEFNDTYNNGIAGSYKIVGYEAIVAEKTTIKVDDKEQTTNKFTKSLVLFIDNIEMDLDGVQDEKDKPAKNYAGIKLYNGDKSYTYTLNDPIDATASKEDNRFLVEAARTMGFVEVDLNKNLIDEKLGGQITALEVVDGKNKVVGSKVEFEETFTYESEFYTCVDSYITEWNKVLEDIENQEVINNWNAFAQEWINNYTFGRGYTDKERKPASIYWKTAGVMGVYLIICGVLGYFILRKKTVTMKPYQIDRARKEQALKAETKVIKPEEKNVSQEENKPATITAEVEEIKDVETLSEDKKTKEEE